MRKNFGAKPVTYPQPVFIIGTYNEDGTPNAMNAAWGGISEEREITICVDAAHKTAKNVVERGAFTVSMGTEDFVVACDYVGLASGNKVPDKLERAGLHTTKSAFVVDCAHTTVQLERAGFHTTKSEFVDAPLIDELPLALECRLISYDTESCRMVGEIVNVCAEESILNEQGNVDPAKLRPITVDTMNHTYLALGRQVGRAFSDGAALL